MRTPCSRGNQAGFSLIEVVIALAVFSFAIVAILGVMISGMNVSRDTLGDQVAVNVATSIANDIIVTPPPSTGEAYSPRFYISNQNAAGGTVGPLYFDQAGNILPSMVGAGYQANLTYRATPPNTGAPDCVNIRVTWPAAAVNPTSAYEVISKTPQ